jgi:hypothetical protein
MLTASHARFLTNRTRTAKFVTFACEAFELWSSGDDKSSLWRDSFAGTAYDDDPNIFHDLAAETFGTRLVDIFQYYLADVLGWALSRRPEVANLLDDAENLADSESIELDDAIKIIAHRQAESVSYNGTREILRTMRRTFGVEFPFTDNQYREVRRLIAVRNVAVHNQSRKNRRYCRDTGESESNIGQLVRLTMADAQAASDDLANFVEAIDSTLCSKVLGYADQSAESSA